MQNEVSNLKIKSEEVKKEVGQSLGNFGKTDISLGLDKLLRHGTLSVLKKQFEERLVSIESEIIKITNENESEKSGLADLVQARKT